MDSKYKDCDALDYNLRPCGKDKLDAVRGCVYDHASESCFILPMD